MNQERYPSYLFCVPFELHCPVGPVFFAQCVMFRVRQKAAGENPGKGDSTGNDIQAVDAPFM